MNISLRRGERIFINGAVLRVDRKVSVELLNDVTFLLENHVMQAEHATTPLKRLYFVIQTMIMSPNDCEATTALCGEMLGSLRAAIDDPRIVAGLANSARFIEEKRPFEALKAVRALFGIEAELGVAASTGISRDVA